MDYFENNIKNETNKVTLKHTVERKVKIRQYK